MGVIGIINIRDENARYSDLYEQFGVSQGIMGRVAEDFQLVRVCVRNIILAEPGEDKSIDENKIKEYDVKIKENLSAFGKSIQTAQARDEFNKLNDSLNKYITSRDKIVQLAVEGKDKEAILLMKEAAPLSSNLEDSIDKLLEFETATGRQTSDELSKNANNTVATMIVILIIALVVAVALGIFISQIISRPVKKLVDTADKLAEGDINVKVDAATKDEIGDLMKSFGKMIANIREQALTVEKIASGNMNIDVKANSDNDLLNKKLIEMIQTIKDLITDIGDLSNAAVDGRLSERGDERKYNGDFKNIINGINKTLDAVVQPIKEATSVLEEMSKGSLQVEVKGNYKGDHAIIKDAINNTIVAFNEVLGSINSASEQVASGAKQISSSSQALSQGSTEQASSIEEITASINGIASQTRQNAANANQANELASTVKEKAVQENKQMAEMVKAMTEINDSSNNISKIIKVIDEIAFQTNILALNAAVEAARAGQHGKGFAVVAEEVRNLAARSADAAKETTAMIEGSIKKVDTGTKISNETAAALNQIVDGIAKAADLVGEIAAASNEQASGITQVNQAIAQVAQVVQINSATSEESAASSEELSSQAELLKELVGNYKLKKNISYKDNITTLTPEVMKMLENLASNDHVSHREVRSESFPKSRITLDDGEFGKYK
ncbi:MAG TPA: methyl-accepting chemotaxis protein [Clostridia bacterium]